MKVHQRRADHWGGAQLPGPIGRHPTRDCQQCGDLKCPAALCEVCREDPDTPNTTCSSGGHRSAPVREHLPGPDTAVRWRAVAASVRGYLLHRELLGYDRPVK